jgi:hypothetical protein
MEPRRDRVEAKQAEDRRDHDDEHEGSSLT